MSIYKLKTIIPVLYTNLKPNEEVTAEEFKVPITDKQLGLLKLLGTLMMETKFTHNCSKLYMQYADYSQEMVAAMLNSQNINTVKGNIRYDGARLKALYEKDILDTILYSENEDELNIINTALVGAINKYPRIVDSTQDLFTVPLPKAPPVYSYEVSDDEFEIIKAAAARISVKLAKITLEKLGEKGIGYLLYLLDTDPVESVDLKRKGELLDRIK